MVNHRDLDPRLQALAGNQQYVVSREQLVRLGWTPDAISWRLATQQWQRLLPEVYSLLTCPASQPQRWRAAILHAGPQAALDSADACALHGCASPLVSDQVHVVVPWTAPARTRGFAVVRRTTHPLTSTLVRGWPVLDPASALVVQARRLSTARDRLALLADALQRGIVSLEQLHEAQEHAPRRGKPLVEDVLELLGAGAHSVAEVDFNQLVARSATLPKPGCNWLLELPDGSRRSPDALWPDAALVHETDGRAVHERADRLTSTHARTAQLQAAGLLVVSSTPYRIRHDGPALLRQLEQLYRERAGRGLPPGVRILRASAPGGRAAS